MEKSSHNVMNLLSLIVCIRERTKCFPEINDKNHFLCCQQCELQKQKCPENDCGEVVHYCYSEEVTVSNPLEVMADSSKLKATSVEIKWNWRLIRPRNTILSANCIKCSKSESLNLTN